jgi:hypothetical protein
MLCETVTFRLQKYRNGGQMWVVNVFSYTIHAQTDCWQSRSPLLFPYFSPLTVTFPKISVILRPLYLLLLLFVKHGYQFLSHTHTHTHTHSNSTPAVWSQSRHVLQCVFARSLVRCVSKQVFVRSTVRFDAYEYWAINLSFAPTFNDGGKVPSSRE